MQTNNTLEALEQGYFKKLNFRQLTSSMAICVCSVGLCISVVFGNRAFFLGLVMAILFVVYTCYQRKVKIVYLLVFFIVFTFSLAMFFKLGSSQGRLLIYKISSDIFREHWLSGLGVGGFKRDYLGYQASYFAKGHYTENELLLADNTYFAFNDYWELVLEWGVGAGVVITGLAYLVFLAIRKSFHWIRFRPFLMFSVCSLLILGTAALFTHVFEKWYWQLIFWLSFVGLVSELVPKLKYGAKFASYLLVLLVVALFNFDQLKTLWYAEDLRDAQELVFMGYQQEGLDCFNRLSQLRDDDGFIFAYAQACALSGNLPKAIELYQSIRAISNTICLRIADCYSELNDPRAERWYQLAVHMVPNRFVSREALFSYYVSHKDYQKARMVGSAILQLPIKVPSMTVDTIQTKVSTSLYRISKLNNL